MEVLYHIRQYFVGIFPYIGLKNRPYRYLQFRILKWPLNIYIYIYTMPYMDPSWGMDDLRSLANLEALSLKVQVLMKPLTRH